MTTIGTRPAPAPHTPGTYYPAIDGLRSIAFLLVFWFHLLPTNSISPWDWGWVGVDIFFVISGFLITGILMDSLHRPDYFRNFYIRRTLRIFPLYYGFWILLLLLTPWLHIEWNRWILSMAAYIGNFFVMGSSLHLHPSVAVILYHPVWAPGSTRTLYIGHLWSLCIEEQFYLVWPAVIWAVRKRTSLLRLCAVLLVLLPLLRFACLSLWPQSLPSGGIYHNTFTRVDGLLAGALLALWVRDPSAMARVGQTSTRRIAVALVTLAPALLACLVWMEKPPRPASTYDPITCTVGFSLIAAASAGLLLLTMRTASRFAGLLQFRPLVLMGRLTYGMYFFHLIIAGLVVDLADKLGQHHLHVPWQPLLLVMTFAISWLSFRLYESQFLRLKTVFAPRPGAIDDPPPDSTSVLLQPEPLA